MDYANFLDYAHQVKKSMDLQNVCREFLLPLLLYQYHLINYLEVHAFVQEVGKVLLVRNLLPLLRVKVLHYQQHNSFPHAHISSLKSHAEEHQSFLEKYNYLHHHKFENHRLLKNLYQQYPRYDHLRSTNLGFFHQLV